MYTTAGNARSDAARNVPDRCAAVVVSITVGVGPRRACTCCDAVDCALSCCCVPNAAVMANVAQATFAARAFPDFQDIVPPIVRGLHDRGCSRCRPHGSIYTANVKPGCTLPYQPGVDLTSN